MAQNQVQPVAQRPRVLVAGTADAVEAVRQALRDEAEVCPAYSVEDALASFASNHFVSVACNVRFDESRMFEFLQALMERSAGVRVVAFRVDEQALSKSIRDAIRNALEALGVQRFVDLSQLRAEYGDEVARETLRKLILDEGFSPPSGPG